jgi:1,4-alpha-glucan branching enzyme
VSYATRRMNEHILRFNRLYRELKDGRVTEPWLADVEAKDNLFPQIDYRIYAS